MATVDVPAYGYGIRYVHGMFRQEMHDGWQVELPETWLAHGNPWEFERRERSYEIGFGGTVESITAKDGRLERHDWKPAERVLAVAFDTPIVGWRGKRVNTLRLWTAQPIDPILLDKFNAGDHIGALRRKQQGRSAHPRALSGRFARRPGRSCGCGRSISSPPPRCRTSCGAISAVRRSRVAARQGGDPAQRHPSGDLRRRTDAPADRRPRHRFRHRPGRSPSAPSATPTTRCCPKRWKPGRCRCSSGCCRATCRSSTRSTPRC